METQNTKVAFDHWCVVELMGHQRIAGRVTEESLFGTALMRVDVPDTAKGGGFTKYFGATAIYAVTPVEELVARAIAESIDQRPVNTWELRSLLLQPTTRAAMCEDADSSGNGVPDWEDEEGAL